MHFKSSKVCIITWSPLASLLFKGLATKHTTVKWTILPSRYCTLSCKSVAGIIGVKSRQWLLLDMFKCILSWPVCWIMHGYYRKKLQVLKSSLGINMKRHVLIFDAFDSVVQIMQTQIDRGKTLWLLCSPIIIPKVGFLDEYIYAQVEQLCQDSSPS